MTLDELTADDGKLLVDDIEVIFNKQDKLYVHKCRVDLDENSENGDLKVTPFFQGFR